MAAGARRAGCICLRRLRDAASPAASRPSGQRLGPPREASPTRSHGHPRFGLLPGVSFQWSLEKSLVFSSALHPTSDPVSRERVADKHQSTSRSDRLGGRHRRAEACLGAGPARLCPPALLAGRLCHQRWCRPKVLGPRVTGRDPAPAVMVSEVGPREATRSAGCSPREGPSALERGAESPPPPPGKDTGSLGGGTRPSRHWGERLVLGDDASERPRLRHWSAR